MKVKIGSVIHSSEEQPIMVIFEGNDKVNIQNMVKEATRYASYADNAFLTEEEALAWMRD